MYRYIIGTLAECDAAIAFIANIFGTGYTAIMKTGNTNYIPIFAADASQIPYNSISYGEFIDKYWQEPEEIIDENQ